MGGRLFLLCILFIALSPVFAQQSKPAPQSAEMKFAGLMEQLSKTGQDSNRAKVYVSLADHHWRYKRNKDSIIAYAEKARVLSKRINFDAGFDNGTYNLARIYAYHKQFDKARALLPQVSKEQQARLLIIIGEDFLFRPALKKGDLDSSYKYFTDALSISRSVGSAKWRHESLIALGKYHFSNGDFTRGKESFYEIIKDLHEAKDSSSEAHIWSELGLYMPDTDTSYADEIMAHTNALKIYEALRDTLKIVENLENIGSVHMNHSNFDTAKKIFLKSYGLRKQKKIAKISQVTAGLAWLSYSAGDLDEALSYTLESEKNLIELQGKSDGVISMLIGIIYADMGLHQKSLDQLLKMPPAKNWKYFLARKIVEQYITLGQPEKTLSFIEEFEKKYPVETPFDRQSLAAAKGDIYTALKNYSRAEKYYIEMIRLDDEAQQFKSREVIPIAVYVTGAEAYEKIAGFYVKMNQYGKAAPYIAKAIAADQFSGNQFYTSNLMRRAWLLQFKVDSATGNYLSAIRSYQQYTMLKDSIFSASRTRQFQQLSAKYETKKMEDDIKSRDGQITALEQNAILRQSNLRQARFTRNITLGASIILLLLGAMLYRQFRQKQRANKLVTTQNAQLQHLVTEKEWLLKEVHHRVKNNLHTIICLLESQAVFLENDALKAIENSQHRIYAMSLIHQRLYQTDNVKKIEMEEYLPEFIQYLKESFDQSPRIKFELDIDPLQLDVSKAIPVALILNESVTNCIKYAFPDKKYGTIKIELNVSGNNIELVVADNGIGISDNLKEKKLNSLGVELMIGLAEDINGDIQFENNNGTTIRLNFTSDPSLLVTAGSYEPNGMEALI